MNHPTQRYILRDDSDDVIYALLLNPGRGYSQEFYGGAPWFSKSLPCFRIKKMFGFPHPFLDLSSKIHTYFHT